MTEVHSRAGTTPSPTAAPAAPGPRPRGPVPRGGGARAACSLLTQPPCTRPPTPGPGAPSGPPGSPAPSGLACPGCQRIPGESCGGGVCNAAPGGAGAAPRAGERGGLGAKEGRGRRLRTRDGAQEASGSLGRVPEPQCGGARVVDQGGAGAGRLPWEFRSIRDAHFGGAVLDLLSWSSRASAHPSTLTLVSKSSGFGFLTWILLHNILSLPASSPSHTSQSRFTFPSSLPRHLRWIAPPLLLSFKLTPPTALHRESA